MNTTPLTSAALPLEKFKNLLQKNLTTYLERKITIEKGVDNFTRYPEITKMINSMSTWYPFRQVLLVEKRKDRYGLSEINPKVPYKTTHLFIKMLHDQEPKIYPPSYTTQSDLGVIVKHIEGTKKSDTSKKRPRCAVFEQEKKIEEAFKKEQRKAQENSPIFNMSDSPENFKKQLKIAFKNVHPQNTYEITLNNSSTSSPIDLSETHRIFHVKESRKNTYDISVIYDNSRGRKNWTSIHIQPIDEESRGVCTFLNSTNEDLRNCVVSYFDESKSQDLLEKKS